MKPNHSGMIRIVANYARLFSTCLIGLFVVRMLLRFGQDTYGLIAFLGTGAGLALVLKEVVRASTIPVLGEAYHSEKPKWFEEIYNSALLCSVIAAGCTVAIFGVFAFFFHLFEFPPEFYNAGLIFIAAMAIQSFFTVLVAPLFNFYVVSERMVPYNIFLMLERAGDIIAAALLLIFLGTEYPVKAVIFYGIFVATFSIIVNVTAAVMIVRVDARLIPDFKLVTRKAINSFMKSAGWNSCVIAAMNLYARVDILIMNLFFGLVGSTVFIVANQAVAYMRQLIVGLVAGMDAVASRVSASQGDDGVIKLIQRSTSLQSMVVFPTMIGLLLFAEPLITTWFRGRFNSFDDPAKTITSICWLMRILVFGVGARCLSEGWTWIMNGAGKVKKYAPAVLIGGILNPIAAIVALKYAPEPYRFGAPAIVFSVLMVSVHLFAIPFIVAREYKLKFLDIVSPMFKPAMTAIMSLGVSYLVTSPINGPIAKPLALGLIFGLTYATAAYFFLLEAADRHRLASVIGKLPLAPKFFRQKRVPTNEA